MRSPSGSTWTVDPHRGLLSSPAAASSLGTNERLPRDSSDRFVNPCHSACGRTTNRFRVRPHRATNDDRGLVFINPSTVGSRIVIRVSAFPRGQRLAAGRLVTYAEVRDERNLVRLGGALS